MGSVTIQGEIMYDMELLKPPTGSHPVPTLGYLFVVCFFVLTLCRWQVAGAV